VIHKFTFSYAKHAKLIENAFGDSVASMRSDHVWLVGLNSDDKRVEFRLVRFNQVAVISKEVDGTQYVSVDSYQPYQITPTNKFMQVFFEMKASMGSKKE
jgi:hypothetical protein